MTASPRRILRRVSPLAAILLVGLLSACTSPAPAPIESMGTTDPVDTPAATDALPETDPETEAQTVEHVETVKETLPETETETVPTPALVDFRWTDGEIIETGLTAGYPRLFTLQDGTLLIGCDNFFGVFVARSTDAGKTWTDIVHASGAYPGAANPGFFQDEDGTVYLGYRSTETREDGTFFGSLQVSVSTDNGMTWAHHSTIYENTEPSGAFKGVWEPHFGILEGKLTCFYANDSTDVITDFQNIEYKQWDEATGAWTNRTVVCDGAAHRSRDGMPVWTPLRDGGYVCAIEGFDPKEENRFVIQLVYSADGVHWSQPVTVMRGKKGFAAAAPYVVELPTGQLVISCQTNECTPSWDTYIMSTVISDGTPVKDLTEASFAPHDYPFGADQGTESNMWNSLYVHDGYLYACTGTSERGILINRYRLAEGTE